MKHSNFTQLILSLVLLVILAACKKGTDNTDSTRPATMDEMKVPSAFNWESSRLISLRVGINMIPAQIGTLCKISVFDGDPGKGGNLLISGAAGYEFPFETSLRIASTLTNLYLKAEDGAAFSAADSVPVVDELSYTFSQTGLKNEAFITSDPDCSGATPAKTLSGNQTINISNGTTYYVTGSFTGGINFSGSGGSINVCGTFHPSFINNMNNSCFITVTQGGWFIYDNYLAMGDVTRITTYANSHVHLGGLNMNGTARLINHCHDFVIGAQFSPSGSVENYGSMKMNGGLNINSSLGLFVTTDSLTITGDVNINSQVTNNGPMEISGHLNLNSATLYNNCRIIVHQDLSLNSGNLTMNGAYLKEDGKLTVNGGATLLLKNNSMISTATYMQNANVQGTGGRSEIKISSSGAINSTYKVTGSIETVTPTGTLTTGGTANFASGATLTKISTATNIIQISSCNPEGIGGSPPIVDTDGDGVANTLDKYPLDATRAFDNYYPSQTGFGSLAFEDLWPGKGDYDMNDLVVDYRVKTVTNAQNNVVDIKPQFYVRAAGSTFRNGFGFQFDGILPGQVASVSGYSLSGNYISLASNGVENGQAKAVVIVFDDYNNVIHHSGSGSFFNTTPGAAYGNADTVKILIHFTTPVPLASVGTAPYNPFLIKNKDRSIEIHLADKLPTSLANTALFGTSSDNSSIAAGRYYKTSNNLPWALNLPVPFEYTNEKTPVIQGYKYFPDWAQSAGVLYTDWYSNKPGYRETIKIFQH